MTTPVFGSSIRRVEDPHLIRGAGRYVDDLRPAGCLHLVFLRSHLAHATIARIDLGAARQARGVVAAWSAADLKNLKPLQIEEGVDGMARPERGVLASGRVRHAGEAVALLVAESLTEARDALELIELDLEPLPVVTDMEHALQDDAPLLYPELGSNLAFRKDLKRGAVKRSFDQAGIVIRERLNNQRLIPAPLEPRGALAWMEGGRLTLRVSSQSTYGVRESVADNLGLAAEDVHVIVEDVGGGFGSKGGCMAEEIAVAEAARRLGRPVKWIEERWENCAVTWHGRGQLQEVELAAQRDGTVLAVRSRILADMGGHLEVYSAFIPLITPDLQTGCYRIPASQSSVLGVYTNTAPTGPYRGAGRPEAAFLIERMMDRLAGELAIDPVELRLHNFVGPVEFPYTNAGKLTYDSGDYGRTLRRLVEVAGYQQLREAQRRARADGKLHGIGIATYVEIAAGTDADQATARLESDGTITVVTGSTPHGQGHQTTWAQIAADQFGVSLDRITVVYGDSDLPAYAVGTFGSRSAAVSGSAVHETVTALTTQLRSLAAAAFEAAPADVVLEAGRLQVRGVPARAMTLEQLALWAIEAGRQEELSAQKEFAAPAEVFPFGAHLAQVEVDRETGAVTVLRYVAVDDCGPVINPKIVDGQVHGAIAQGLGQALYEGVVYDQDGQLLTGNLTTYLLPTAADLPMFETDRTVTPSPNNPMGVKGVGEGGTTGSTPAVANAVMDALRPLGIHQLEMPLSPYRIWSAIRERS
ncbi:MAG TPA: xanthine dehydrogenase family protein molybdopterin-binding subunit [Candidatus Dormibacteraeota bacterium]